MKPKAHGTDRAFSLVEVLFALVMVSTVIVGAIGLLTTGIRMIGDAGDVTIKGRIAQNLMGELQLADWEKLDDYNQEANRYRYYDYNGKELEKLEDEMQIYTAFTQIDDAGFILPGSSQPQSGLKNASVFISGKPGIIGKQEVQEMADSFENNPGVAVYSKVLVKMNRNVQP